MYNYSPGAKIISMCFWKHVVWHINLTQKSHGHPLQQDETTLNYRCARHSAAELLISFLFSSVSLRQAQNQQATNFCLLSSHPRQTHPADAWGDAYVFTLTPRVGGVETHSRRTQTAAVGTMRAPKMQFAFFEG